MNQKSYVIPFIVKKKLRHRLSYKYSLYHMFFFFFFLFFFFFFFVLFCLFFSNKANDFLAGILCTGASFNFTIKKKKIRTSTEMNDPFPMPNP